MIGVNKPSASTSLDLSTDPDLPSPPKKAKLMIGVNKPSASTSLDLSTDPVFDEDTMPFPANSAEPVSDRSEEERLIINDPCDGENAADDLNFQNYVSYIPGLIASTNNDDHPRDNMIVSKKYDTLETYNSNNNGITAEKIQVQENNNTHEHTPVMETKSKTRRTSLKGAELENVNDFTNGGTKDTLKKDSISSKLRDATPSMSTITPTLDTTKQNKERGQNECVTQKKTRPRKRKIPETAGKDNPPDQSINSSQNIPRWEIALNDQSLENTKDKIVLKLRKEQADGDNISFKSLDDNLLHLLEKNKHLSIKTLNKQTSCLSTNQEVRNSAELRRTSPVNSPNIQSKELLKQPIVPQLIPINIAQKISNSNSQSESRKLIRKKHSLDNRKARPSKSLEKEFSNLTQKSINPASQGNNNTLVNHSQTENNKSKKNMCDDQQPRCSKSLDKESFNQAQNTLNKGSQRHNATSVKHLSTENPTPKKNIIDDQQPCCSKSLGKEAQNTVLKSNQTENSTPKKKVNNKQQCSSKSLEGNDLKKVKGGSPAEKVNNDKAANQSTNSATPEKQNSSTDFAGNKGSPRKNVFKSPGIGSPFNNRSIKSLKSKEGKQLHTRQLDEMVKLFKRVISTRHLRSFLDESEQKKITTFLSMEENIQYALMKLFVWQRQFYSIYAFCSKAQIEFNDDKDVMDMFDYLRKEEFIDTEYRTMATLSELLDKLHDVKIRAIMEELKIKPAKTKYENVGKLLTLAGTQSTLTKTKTFKDLILDKVEKKMGFAFRIRGEVFDTFYNVFLLGTFANAALDSIQQYFNTIIHEKAVFPETSIEDYPVFYTKSQFRQYGEALKLYKELDGYLASRASEEKNLGIYKSGLEAYRQLQDLLTENVEEPTSSENDELPHLKRFTAQHVYCKILSACCKSLYTKHNGHSLEVMVWLEFLMEKFPNSKRIGQWYHTLILLHMRHLDNINYEKAANLLIEALDTKKDVLSDISKYELGALGKSLKISRKHRIDQLYHDRVAQIIPKPIDAEKFPKEYIDAQCIRSELPGKKRNYIDKSGGEMVVRGVEQVAIDYYAENGYPGGYHCEGQLVKALLMLCFWDIIYKPKKVIPGTFISPLQTAPLDMFTTNFYTNRQDLIHERLEEIRSGWSEKDLIEFAVHNWREHAHERAAFGMVMNVIPEEAMVEVLIVVMGRRVLAAIFERLIKSFGEFGKGMPDLLIWNVDKRYCKFVEVKGEGDKLSNAQKLWLQYLKRIGASIEVCHVHSMGSKRKNIKNIKNNKKVLTENNADHNEDLSVER